MMESDFVIESRYEIRPGINLVVDRIMQKEVRVEPRLMKLLCILAKQSGSLVTREQLVSDIWNDYGGGEAGLNHAISSLRKILNDNSKELIETIPTRGYILHAEVTVVPGKDVPEVAQKRRASRQVIIISSMALLASIIVVALFVFQGEVGKGKGIPDSPTEVPFDEVSKKDGENAANTIITVGKDSTVYKLKVIGDGRPEFYINGRLLSPDEMEEHLELINNMKRRLRER